MAKLTIDRGTAANDGTGDNLRAGANKVNLNFDEIYTEIGDGTTLGASIKFKDDTSTVATLGVKGDTLGIFGGTGLSSTISGTDVTLAVDATVVTASSTTTLTNKTLTSPIVSGLTLSDGNIVIEGATADDFETTITVADPTADRTVTVPNATGTIVFKDTTDTLTNKTVNLASNTVTGTLAQFNTACSDGTFSTTAGTETLTNKTINASNNTITNIAASGISGAFDNTTAGQKLRFNFAGTGAFPDESTYEGMFAYDTTGDNAYVADTGGWVKLISENASIGDLSNVNITGVADTYGLIWNSSQGRFNVGALGGGADNVKAVTYKSPDSTVVQSFTVAVATKTDQHYQYGTGSANGFTIDGEESPVISIADGVYKFDQADATNAGHPLLFYYDDAKTRIMSTGVTTSGTPGNAGAYTQIVVNGATPTPLYYECSAHTYMGHGLNVINGRESRLNITTDKTNTGDGSDTTFTVLADKNVDEVLVFVNGICLVPTDDYTISGTTLTFQTAPANNAEIVFRYLG